MVIGELLVQWKYLLWQNILLANNPRRVLLEKKRLDERVIWFRRCGLVLAVGTADTYLQLLSNYFSY